MPRSFSTGIEVPVAGDQHPSEAWWSRVGSTTNAALLRMDAAQSAAWKAAVEALRKDSLPRSEASQYGIPGPPSSLSVGTVKGGVTAAASITGTAPKQSLNLTLPQGPQGPVGPGGAFSLVPTGKVGVRREGPPLNPQWVRGVVPNGSDVRSLAIGVWTVPSNAVFDSLVNAPAGARGLGIIEVNPFASTYKTIRWTLVPTSGAPQQWVSSQFSSGWGPWQATGWNKGEIPTGSDVTKLSAGAYRVSSFATFDTLVNAPAEARGIGTVVVLELTSSARTITWVTAPSTGDPKMFYCYVLSSGVVGWFDWTPQKTPATTPGSAVADTSNAPITTSATNAAARHMMLREAFYRRYRVSTGGKAAVSLRFDDGHNAFKADILPMLRARGLPCSIAVCSRRWNHVENNAVTPDEMNGWVLNDKVEVWNHTATHRDATGGGGTAEVEIVEGLRELRTQLPSAEIWGWYAPGIENGFDGFLPTREPHQLSATLAGQLALANHAAVSGYVAGSARRPLDPMPQTTAGFAHYSLDGRVLSDAKAEIDRVVAERARENFMMHPSRLDLSNGISRADMAAILDYLVAQRNAGKLVILSPYQMEAATI